MNTIVKLDVGTLAIIGGVFIPILVALLTKSTAPQGLKSILNALASAVVGYIAVATQANGVVNVRTAVGAIGLTWIVSISTYYGLWKPTGVAPAISKSTDTFGLG